MRKFFKKAIKPLITFSMILGVGVSLKVNDVVKVFAAEETYTYTTGDGVWIGDTEGNEREYYSTNFTFNHKKNNSSSVIVPTYAELRVYARHSMEVYPTIAGSKVITSLEVTCSSNSYATALSNATVLAGTEESTASQQTDLATVNQSIVTFDFTGIPNTGYVKFSLAAQARTTKWKIGYEEAGIPDEITTLSVSPTSKTYWTTDVLEADDFTLNYTKNGTATSGNGSSFDYTAKIGSGTGDSFTGRNIVWGTTKPLATDTTIQFRATGTNGTPGVYLTADVALTVSAPTVSSISISGTMTNKSYFTGGTWDPTGLTVTALLSNGVNEDVTSEVVWTFDPAAPDSTAITSVVVTAEYEGKTANSTQTGIVVSEKVSTLLISEAYGGGGNSGATLKNDFIELYNATNSDIDLEEGGYHLYYYSATGTSSAAKLALSGTILANSYFLVQHAAGSGGTQDLPTPDQEGEFAMGGSGFRIALTNDINEPAGPTDPSVLDYVGCSSKATYYEGIGPAPAPSNTNSISRLLDENNVPVDTDNNAADFVAGTPDPQNTALSIADYVMAEDVANQCIERYPIAKAKMLATSNGQRAFFESGADHETANGHSLVDARARYEAWARYHNDAQPYGGELSPMPYVKLTNTTLNTIVASVVIVGLSVIAVYYFYIRKKKHN